MADNFTPLFPRSSGAGALGARFRGEAGKEPGGAFQPMAVTPVSGHSCASASEPRVTLERDGDRVSRIRVECACGQVIVLVCEY